MQIFWNCYLSMSVGSQLPDPSLLPALSEIAARILETIPVHHFWLTDMLSALGVESPTITSCASKLMQSEQLFVSHALSHSAAPENFNSAAEAQFYIDATHHLMAKALTYIA